MKSVQFGRIFYSPDCKNADTTLMSIEDQREMHNARNVALMAAGQCDGKYATLTGNDVVQFIGKISNQKVDPRIVGKSFEELRQG